MPKRLPVICGIGGMLNAVFVVGALSGCQLAATTTIEQGPGPVMAAGNVRGQAAYRCWPKGPVSSMASTFASNPSRQDCETLFISPSGKRFMREDLGKSVADYLIPIARSRAWIDESLHFMILPANLYLVSVDPIVVLWVPQRNSQLCQDPTHCVSLGRVTLSGMDFTGMPQASQEVFWFSPGMTQGLVPVVPVDDVYKVPLEGLNATLSRDGKSWVFDRR
jgi:hypothetical protein